jgi:hypothetical protein
MSQGEMPYDSAEKTVEKVFQLSLRACAPQASHQATVVPSGMRSRPRGQTPVRLPGIKLPSQCSDAA